jgi:hypothetical protein
MPSLAIVRANWAGAPVVGPSTTTWHCDPDDVAVVTAGMRAFFQGLSTLLPIGLQITVATTGDVIDEASGDVTTTWTAPLTVPVVGAEEHTWNNGVGMRVVWATIGVIGGRQVRGSTFVVPVTQPGFEGAGNITSSYIGVAAAAAGAVVSTPVPLRIYSRKTAAHAGVSFPVMGFSVPDKVSWLRTRRT